MRRKDWFERALVGFVCFIWFDIDTPKTRVAGRHMRCGVNDAGLLSGLNDHSNLDSGPKTLRILGQVALVVVICLSQKKQRNEIEIENGRRRSIARTPLRL